MRIFVVDDHPLMRDAIVMLLRRVRADLDVVELDRIGGMQGAADQGGVPDLICLDLKLPDTHEVGGVQTVKSWFTDVPLVVISASPASEYEERALEAGADVYIEKSAGATEISNALRLLVLGDSDFETALPTEKLSKRQKQLLGMLDKGLSNRDIATQLEISEHTVKVHLWRLFRRLNVKNRSQASHWARTSGALAANPTASPAAPRAT